MKFIDDYVVLRPNDATISDKRADGASQVLELAYGVHRRLGLDEVAPILQALPTGDCPVEDAWQLYQQALGKRRILAPIEAFNKFQDDEARGERTARIRNLK